MRARWGEMDSGRGGEIRHVHVSIGIFESPQAAAAHNSHGQGYEEEEAVIGRRGTRRSVCLAVGLPSSSAVIVRRVGWLRVVAVATACYSISVGCVPEMQRWLFN